MEKEDVGDIAQLQVVVEATKRRKERRGLKKLSNPKISRRMNLGIIDIDKLEKLDLSRVIQHSIPFRLRHVVTENLQADKDI